jgi:3D (Asp-Asp-Asp) domain-containing protein
MKYFFIAAGLFLLLAPDVSARQLSVPKQPILARITVYWASGGGGSDRWTRQHQSAIGARLRAGHCAVDPRRIPYGSKVTLPDGPLLAVDTGSAVVSRKAARRSGRNALERNAIVVDRFFETKRQALNWASRNPTFMLVQVSPPGSPPGPVPHAQKTSRALPPNNRQQLISPVHEVARDPQRDLRERRKSSRYVR